MMTTKRHLWLAAALVLPTSCDRSAGHGKAVGRSDCETLDYEARSLQTRVNVANRVGIDVATSKEAIREVDERVERYFASWKTACMDYKNGALTREEYREESQRIRRAMERFEELSVRLEKAESAEEFETTLKETWNAVADASERIDVTAQMKVMAKRPGESTFSVAPPGASFPSGSELYTVVRLNEAANLQIYQVAATGERVVLFPDPEITAKNPIPAGGEVRLPPNGVYELDDQDLGLEDLHVVVTPDPLDTSAPPTAARADLGTADCKTRGLKFKADACPRTRGLRFKADAGNEVSLQATNAAAQRGVHLVYTFHHVGDAKTYGRKCPDDPKVNCRGVEPMRGVIDKRPPKMPGNFEACPDDAVPKEMPGPQGGYERWCVETNAGGVLVDHGPYRRWYGNGQLWISGLMQMGQRVGTWSTFDASGSALAEVTY